MYDVNTRAGGWPAAMALIYATVGLAGSGCGGEDDCPTGESSICSDGECRCGPPCNNNNQCGGGEVCAEYRYDPGHGVCVDGGWAGTSGMSGSSGGGSTADACGGCATGSYCTSIDGEPVCLTECSADAECGFCCTRTQRGQGVCAPSADYCGGGGTATDDCGGCAAGSTCAYADGVPMCLENCSDDAQCSLCCASTDTGIGVCSPHAGFCGDAGSDGGGGTGGGGGGGGGGSGGGGSGSGPQCESANSCLSIREWLTGTEVCQIAEIGQETLLPVFENGCGSPVWCKICGVYGGSYGECTEWRFSAYDALGGWATDFVWCDADSLSWVCVVDHQDGSALQCLDGWP